MKTFIFSLFLLSSLVLLNCETKEEEIPILKYLEKLTFPLNIAEKTNNIYFQMNVDDILTSTIYLYVYITDPTSVRFNYKLEKGSSMDYQQLDAYLVTNHGSSHTIYYKISKPDEQGYKLYVNIRATNFDEGQSITVESTDSMINFYLIIGLILGISLLITVVVIFLSFYSIYSIKRDKSINESNDTVIIERVGPEDYS